MSEDTTRYGEWIPCPKCGLRIPQTAQEHDCYSRAKIEDFEKPQGRNSLEERMREVIRQCYDDDYVPDGEGGEYRVEVFNEEDAAQAVARIAREEMIERLVAERKRAVDLCYSEYNRHLEKAKNQKSVRNELYFIEERLADECRMMGNFISGGNALSAALGETMEDRIRKELTQQKQP